MTNSTRNHSFGTDNEWAVDELMVIFIFIFLITLLAQHLVTHVFRLSFVGDAGTAMITGLICGAFVKLIKSDDSETTELKEDVLSFSPTVFFCVLLPPIIFCSGYQMKASWFFNNVWKILAFAFIGTFVSSLVIGGFLRLFGMMGASLNLSFAECLAFGALISATDPVTTLAVFEKLRVDPHLFYIVFGESVLNDAVAIVLFHTFEKFIGESFSSKTAGIAFADFILIFGGSTLIGCVFGCIASLIFKHIRLRDEPMMELSFFILFSYLPFVAGELLYMSGIVAILFTGLTMKHYTYLNLSDKVREMSEDVVRLLASLAETVVFIDLGTSIWSFHKANAGFVIWSIVLCLASRALHVYPISWLLNQRKIACNMRVRPLVAKEMHMIAFSGLRGAIAYALSVNFPGPNQQYIKSCTTIVVMLSVLLLGGSTEPVLKFLNIRIDGKKTTRRINGVSAEPFSYHLRDAQDDAGQWQIVEDEESETKTPRRRDSSDSTDREILEDLVPNIQLALNCTCLLRLDKQYMKPFLVRRDRLSSPTHRRPRRVVVGGSSERSIVLPDPVSSTAMSSQDMKRPVLDDPFSFNDTKKGVVDDDDDGDNLEVAL